MRGKGKFGHHPGLVYDAAMTTTKLTTLLGAALLLTQCQSAVAIDETAQALVTRFWNASAAETAATAQQLEEAAPDAATLFSWLRAGPQWSAEVPTGELHLSRTDAEGTEFPYVVLVPQDYNPGRAYPVEFNLHGGISRPKPQAGESFWRNGYDQLREPERIVVVPAAWEDAFWWFDNQADNIPAILHQLKQTYHVDDNRVTMSGVSDGGTGAYFFAFLQPTEWAAFLPYIGNLAVLRNPAGRVSYPLSFDNLAGKPLYIVNGENDPLYPAARIQPFIDLMARANVDHVFKVIPNGGHNTRWLPEERPAIERFKTDHVRDPLPERIQWATDRTDRYNRNHWLRVDTLSTPGQPGRVVVERTGNVFQVTAFGVSSFTLLLNPDEVDFSQPVQVLVNGTSVLARRVEPSEQTLLEWAARERDRTMLFMAELPVHVPAPAR